jgi:UDP:flavonoid glycosyltransferase YjiC (YdhE family)
LTKRRVVLATFGSLGDLHPMLAVALRLRGLGVEVVIATSEGHRAKVEAEGLGFAPVRPDFTDIERDLGVEPAEIMRRMISGDDFLFKDVLFPYVRKSYEDALTATAGADLVAGTNFAFGGRLAAEVRGLPFVALVLQPLTFLSAHDPPILLPYPWLGALPIKLGPKGAELLFGLVKQATTAWAKPLQKLRRELHLPAERDPVFTGHFEVAQRVLGLYSPLLGAPQPDFPAGTAIVGSTFYDREARGADALSSELERFLAAGPPPAVFTLGSAAVLQGERFYRTSLQAAERLGLRAVLLVGPDAAARWAGETGLSALALGYAPHSQLFPRARLIVHHGGIGTTAQALRAGRPQLVVPFFADQPDNAARLVRLGVALTSPSRRYTPARATATLADLLGEPRFARAAEGAAEIVRREDGAEAAAIAIAEVLARSAALAA